MSDKYSREILTEIHKNNHPKINKVSFNNGIKDFSFLPTPNSGSFILENLNPGLYYIWYNNLYYSFTLYDGVYNDDYIKIHNANRVLIYRSNGKINNVILSVLTNINAYENTYTLDNTVNDYINEFIINGKTTKEYAEMDISEDKKFKAGSILIWFDKNNIPENWISMDGQALDKDQYSELYNLYGEEFGKNDRLNTFNIPNQNDNITENYTYILKTKTTNTTSPVGSSIIWFTGNIPEGWMLLDGRSLSKAEYSELYSIIGDKYGSDDDTFKIPSQYGTYDLSDESNFNYIIKVKDISIKDENLISSSILWFNELIPEGWVLLDGRELSRTTYSDLYEKIGTYYGDGNGVTTFNVPNENKDAVELDYHYRYIMKIEDTSSHRNKVSPEYPGRLNSIDQFYIVTSNNQRTVRNNMYIKLKNNIKSLPDGSSDILYINCVNKYATILFKVGRLILTGSESWEYREDLSSNNYNVFFMRLDTLKLGDNNTSVNCNYFESISYSRMINKSYLSDSGISNSNDLNNNGIFIRMPKLFAKDLDKFKLFLRDAFRTNPVIVEYLLKNEFYKTISLSNYRLQTYYGETIMSIDKDIPLQFTYNTLNNIGEQTINFTMPILEYRLP